MFPNLHDGNDAAMTNTPAPVAAPVDSVTLSVPTGRAFRHALRLLVAGLGSSSQLSYEELDELQLAVESLLAHRVVAADSLRVEADLDESSLSLALGPFLSADDPGGRRVFEQLVRRARVVRREDGSEWVELGAGVPAIVERGS